MPERIFKELQETKEKKEMLRSKVSVKFLLANLCSF